jgi:hypothetical protein
VNGQRCQPLQQTLTSVRSRERVTRLRPDQALADASTQDER